MNWKMLLAVGCAASLLSSCGKNDYPPEIVANTVNACMLTSGGNEKMCSCVMDKVQEKYSLEEFIAIDTKIRQGDADATAQMMAIGASCA